MCVAFFQIHKIPSFDKGFRQVRVDNTELRAAAIHLVRNLTFDFHFISAWYHTLLTFYWQKVKIYNLHHYTSNVFNLRLMDMLRGMLFVIDRNTLHVCDWCVFISQTACMLGVHRVLALVCLGDRNVIHSHLNMTSRGRQREHRVAQKLESVWQT